MIVTNKAARLITIGTTKGAAMILPGATVDLPEECENNRIIKKMIARKELVEGVQEEKVAEKPKKAAQPAKDKTVDEMTKAELIAYAEAKGIDLTGADDKASMLALIKAAEA